MPAILPVLLCLQPVLTKTSCRQLAAIVEALLAISGRITQRGISRWTTEGGSYRTVQRFFQTPIVWRDVLIRFFLQQLYDKTDTYLLVGDETVVGKAGKKTYGLDWFFSSLAGKPIPGIACFGIALVSQKRRRAYPLCAEQVVRSEAEKQQARQNKLTRQQRKAKQTPPRKRGRPQGSKNKNKAALPLSEELQRIQTWVRQVQARLPATFQVGHLVLDGHFGTPASVQMAREVGLHLISKLHHNAALYQEPTPEEKQAHPRRKYGAKVDYAALPQECLVGSEQGEQERLEIYQIRCWHKDFPQRLNVVVIVKTDLTTKRCRHVVLFSSDLEVDAHTLWDHYALRFQIEFVFRDAKQHFGLDDFQGQTKTAVTNAVGLSLLMVNLSASLLEPMRQENPDASILDLKASFRGRRYLRETWKMLPVKPEGIVWEEVVRRVCRLGSIHSLPAPSQTESTREPKWQKRVETERRLAA